MKWISLLLCLMLLSSIASAQDPADYFDSLGSKLLSKGNYSQALDLFNKSLDQTESAAAWTHKGNALRSMRQYNTSIESLNQALEIDDSYAPALAGLSDTYLAQKSYMAVMFGDPCTCYPRNTKSFLMSHPIQSFNPGS